MDIKAWLSSRLSSSTQKAQPNLDLAELKTNIAEELGEESALQFQQVVLNKCHPIVRDLAKNSPDPISFVEKILLSKPDHSTMGVIRKNAINETAQNLSKLIFHISESDMKKAIGSEFDRIKRAHDETGQHYYADHSAHASQSPASPVFASAISSPEKISRAKAGTSGISAKMMHWVGNDVYMSKPYHKKIESATKSWVKVPVLGWSTMATKNMFNAGGIGHLAEDVGVYEHEGVPLTVHKFAKGFKDLTGDFDYNKKTDPLHVQQIAVMDYLANNMDRHHGNILVAPHEEDKYKVLAIDHERNFQYVKNLKDHWRNSEVRPKENPHEYMRRSSLKHLKHDFMGWQDLAGWWKESGNKIRESFTKDLENIKDYATRQHLSKNFARRWDAMNEWAQMVNDEHIDPYELYSMYHYFPEVNNIPLHIPRVTKTAIESQLANMKLKDGLGFLAEIANKRPRITPNQLHMIHRAMHGAIDKASPEELVEAFHHSLENPGMNTQKLKQTSGEIVPRNAILNNIIKTNKHDHIKALADYIDALPEDKREILGHWSGNLRAALDEGKS